MEISLREFRRRDFDMLWKIDQECFPPGIAYSRHELSDYILRRGTFTLVAETMPAHERSRDAEDANPAGIVGFLVADKQRTVGHIVTLDVVALARRSGAGSSLLVAAEERLRANGCLIIKLEAAVDNAPALAFYKRHSYSTVGRIAQYYGNGLDALTLEKQT